MTTQTSTKTLLDWMYSTSFEDIPPDVRQLTTLALYDGIGGNLACSLLPMAHRMADFVKIVGGAPDCSIIGFPERTSAVNAALVNGTLGHADEVDAIEGDGLGAHILAANLAAALSAGQLAGASGQEVLRAVVLGYEVTKRTHRVAAHTAAGGARSAGPPATLIDAGNTMGATAAAGIVLGLPPEKMDIAFGLAAAMACGITPFARETGHMVKSLVRGGLGARNGVMAALMAQLGYDAPRDIFDGAQGFFHSRLGVEEPGLEFLSGLGVEYGISSVVFKRHCGGGPNQAPRQGLLELMAENHLTSDDIATIQVEVAPAGFNTITQVHHPSIEGKDVLALAAVYGGIGFRETHNEKYYKSPAVLALRERSEILLREDWKDEGRFHALVTIRTNDGRELRLDSIYRRMKEEDIDAKFHALVGMRAGEAKAQELAQALKGWDKVSNIAQVMTRLQLPAAKIEDF
jgi:2-methylcitrate dehydratase PrpD